MRRAAHIPDTLLTGGLTLEIRASRALLGGSDMQLTKKEFAVLLLLAENEGRLITTKRIYETVWKQASDASANGAVKTVMSRLRRKLGDEFMVENDREMEGYILSRVAG